MSTNQERVEEVAPLWEQHPPRSTRQRCTAEDCEQRSTQRLEFGIMATVK